MALIFGQPIVKQKNPYDHKKWLSELRRSCKRGRGEYWQHTMKIANLDAAAAEKEWPYYKCDEHGWSEAL